MTAANPFVLEADAYRRDLDVVKHYVDDAAMYLSVMTGKDYGQCAAFVKKTVRPGGALGMVDPIVRCTDRPNFEDRFEVEIPLTQYLRDAIKDADIAPEQVGYVNMHGTSTPVGDKLECLAIQRVFGDHSKQIKVSSSKSMHGHLLGAAGGLETIVAVMAVKTGKIPPTINVDNQDPECELDVTANVAGTFDSEYAMNNGFGFGGTNGCLILRKV